MACLRIGLTVMAVAALAGCATFGTQQRNPVPVADVDSVTLGTTQVIRYWGDAPLQDDGPLRGLRSSGASGKYLSLSGGGVNGAYGAGYLVGWTKRGDRPQFDIVTGISVGALIAPMAFLGPRYDGRLEQVFANLAVEKESGPGMLAALLGAPAIATNAPIMAAAKQLIDQQALDEIAEQHKRGRRLLIGTTNLDAERPVVWDIGAIAASNIPDKLSLVHQIMLASAAVPGLYPPILIHVRDAAGQGFDELHVDGGVTQQVVLLPKGLKLPTGGPANRKLYVIYNGTLAPSRDAVQMQSLPILERAIPTLLKYRGRGDLIILEDAVHTLGVTYQITAIPPQFPAQPSVFGNPAWIEALYNYGLQAGQSGYWPPPN